MGNDSRQGESAAHGSGVASSTAGIGRERTFYYPSVSAAARRAIRRMQLLRHTLLEKSRRNAIGSQAEGAEEQGPVG